MKVKACLLLSLVCIVIFQSYVVSDNLPTPEQLIASHLNAIGAKKALSQIKSIGIFGASDVEFIQGMRGKMMGPAMLISQGNKMGISMEFSDINYQGEYFAYDGKSVTVKNFQPGTKTPIADFLFRYDKIMKNGLLGGVFSNSWPLLNVESSNPIFMEVSKAKIDGKEVYELEYRPQDRHGDMKIRIFFETDTYRHVRTVYKVSLEHDASSGRRDDPADNDWAISGMATGSTFYTLTEKFSDFRKVGQLTMPHKYELDYMVDGLAKSGFIGKWKIDVRNIGFNAQKIDPKLFIAEK